MSVNDDSLAHFGVKGQKWGVTRAKLGSKNSGYSDQQRKRDKQVYGRTGVRRINRAMNKGDQISTARGDEKTRRDRVMGKNKYVRQGGKVAGALTGVVVGNVGLTGLSRLASSRVGQQTVNRVFGNSAGRAAAMTISAISSNPVARVAVSAGAAKVGSMLAGDAAVGINMRVNGYDPSRK